MAKPINRFFVKMVNTYVVYDRLTGRMVGSTIVNESVVKRVLTPKGFKLNDAIDPAVAKIPYGQEQEFHNVFAKLRYSSEEDKVADAIAEKAAKKS